MSIQELLNPEEETPVFQEIPTAEEVFDQVNTPQEEAEPELELKPIPTNAEALAAVSIVIDHMEGTGTAEGLNSDSPLQKYIDMLKSKIAFSNKKQACITDFYQWPWIISDIDVSRLFIHFKNENTIPTPVFEPHDNKWP